MKWKLTILLVIASLRLTAQSNCDCFNRLYNLSNVYSSSEDWPMVVSALKDGLTFLDKEQAGDFYYELAGDYVHLNADSAALYFTKAIERGYPANWIKGSYPDVYKKMDSDKIKQYTIANRSKIDFDVYDKFVKTLAIDQSVRDGTLFPENEIFHGTPEKRAFIDTLSLRVDSATFEFTMWVLNNYGFPSEHELGFYPSGFLGLLLHIAAQDNNHSKAVLQKLDELNAACKFPQKSTILFLKDRQKLYTTGKGYCGVAGYNRYAAIEDVTKADSIRLANNQVRLQDEVFRSDSISVKNRTMLYNKGYKPKPYPKNYFCLKKYHLD